MRASPSVPGHTDPRAPLLVVVWSLLRNRRELRPGGKRPNPDVDHLPGNSRRRLRIPRAIPAHSIRDGQPGRYLPLVLRIQADSCLVFRGKGVGLEGCLPVQAKTLEIEIRVRIVKVC